MADPRIERVLDLSVFLGLGWTKPQVEAIAGHPQFGDLAERLETQAAEKAAADTRQAEGLVAAALHLRDHGLVATYVCWSCRSKFKAAEKDPHICPGCGTDLDAD